MDRPAFLFMTGIGSSIPTIDHGKVRRDKIRRAHPPAAHL